MGDTVMMRYTLLAIFLIAVTLLCLADEGEALRKKSRRRRKSVSNKSSSNRHIESQIKHLERKFKSLSSKSCQDGAKGKDGDCNNICSEGFQLTFEDAESNTGRAACCKPGEVVTPTGSCRPDGSKGKFVPPVCYQEQSVEEEDRSCTCEVLKVKSMAIPTGALMTVAARSFFPLVSGLIEIDYLLFMQPLFVLTLLSVVYLALFYPASVICLQNVLSLELTINSILTLLIMLRSTVVNLSPLQ